MCIKYTNKKRKRDSMYYKIVKNKIKFYEIKVDERIEKIKDKIIKKHGIKEHRNLITTPLFNPIEKNAKIINFTYKHKFLFLACEFDYDIIKYPNIIRELELVLEKGDYKNLSFLRKYQIPSSIKNLEEGRYKNKLIKREYPFAQYIKEIKSCFKTVLINEVEFIDEVDMLNKILEFNPDIKNKKRIEYTRNILEENEIIFNTLNEEEKCYL